MTLNNKKMQIGKYEIKYLTDCPGYAIGLKPLVLLKNGKEIARHTHDERYIFSLKNRLESGEKFNWITKFKARWID